MEQFVAPHPGMHTNHSMTSYLKYVINRKIQIRVHQFCSWSFLTRPYMERDCGQPPSGRQTSL